MVSHSLKTFEDPQSNISLERIMQADFQPLKDEVYESTSSTVWFEATIKNTYQYSQLIAISFGRLSYVNLFELKNGISIDERKSGFFCPRSQIKEEDSESHFILNLRSGEEKRILLKAQEISKRKGKFKFTIEPAEFYRDKVQSADQITWTLKGGFWCLFLYLLVTFIFNRKKYIYLWMLVFMLGLGLYAFSLRGIFIDVLFPENPGLGWAFNEFFYHLSFVGAYLFAIDFWQVRKLSRLYFNYLRGLVIFLLVKGVTGGVFIYLTLDDSSLLMVNICTFPFETFVPGLIIMSFWRHYSQIQRIVSLGTFIISILCMLRVYIFIIHGDAEIDYLAILADIGGIGSILVLATGLIAESRRNLLERNAALTEMNEMQTAQNVILEGIVEKRTEEVSEANKELSIKIQTLNEKNEQIESSLHEKQLLLKEIHHRIKNNFQIISSLLALQIRDLEDERSRKIALEGQNRIKSMALIHQKLYQNDDFSIDMHDYISTLLKEIQRMFATYSITTIIEVHENFKLDIDTAIPLGLIINELITNAFKYGLGNENGNTIRIALMQKEGYHQLTVADSGPGISEQLDVNTATSLGLRLVTLLSEQLMGEVKYTSNNGAEFHVLFKDKSMRENVD